MCLSTNVPAQQAQTPAPPPPPPAENPTAPVLNETAAASKSGAAWNAAQRRGTDSLRIDLATPGMTAGNGLAIS